MHEFSLLASFVFAYVLVDLCDGCFFGLFGSSWVAVWRLRLFGRPMCPSCMRYCVVWWVFMLVVLLRWPKFIVF